MNRFERFSIEYVTPFFIAIYWESLEPHEWEKVVVTFVTFFVWKLLICVFGTPRRKTTSITVPKEAVVKPGQLMVLGGETFRVVSVEGDKVNVTRIRS